MRFFINGEAEIPLADGEYSIAAARTFFKDSPFSVWSAYVADNTDEYFGTKIEALKAAARAAHPKHAVETRACCVCGSPSGGGQGGPLCRALADYMQRIGNGNEIGYAFKNADGATKSVWR